MNLPKHPAVHLLIIVMIVVVANLLWLFREDNLFRSLDGSLRIKLNNTIDEKKPDIVLLGNSMLDEGIDVDKFEQMIGKPVLKISWGGSASAWWYLVCKNVISQAEGNIETVAIFFRDSYLTDAGRRVLGKNRPGIEAVSEVHEPVLNQKAYISQTNHFTYLLMKYAPLYSYQTRIQEYIGRLIKNRLVGPLWGLKPGRTDQIIESVFDENQMDQELLGKRQLKAESGYKSSAKDFKEVLADSFLPEIISLLKEKSIQPVFVRVKRRRDLVPGNEDNQLKMYIEDLANFLKKEGAVFIDYTGDGRIQPQHYGAGDHLNRSEGRTLFTRIVVESLLSIDRNKLTLEPM